MTLLLKGLEGNEKPFQQKPFVLIFVDCQIDAVSRCSWQIWLQKGMRDAVMAR